MNREKGDCKNRGSDCKHIVKIGNTCLPQKGYLEYSLRVEIFIFPLSAIITTYLFQGA
jgi:hypothetical protein